jgi:hypothetical protein
MTKPDDPLTWMADIVDRLSEPSDDFAQLKCYQAKAKAMFGDLPVQPIHPESLDSMPVQLPGLTIVLIEMSWWVPNVNNPDDAMYAITFESDDVRVAADAAIAIRRVCERAIICTYTDTVVAVKPYRDQDMVGEILRSQKRVRQGDVNNALSVVHGDILGAYDRIVVFGRLPANYILATPTNRAYFVHYRGSEMPGLEGALGWRMFPYWLHSARGMIAELEGQCTKK